MAAAAPADNSKSWFPLAGLANDGWSTSDRASATCFCGAVQLGVPTEGEGLIASFVCNCSDCHKITASMFASNFTVADTHLEHVRGRDNLTAFAQAKTIASGGTMTNYFCKTCGTLMYRVAERFPGWSILRIGTVDDFRLHETKLKPTVEQFTGTRPCWLGGVQSISQVEGSAF